MRKAIPVLIVIVSLLTVSVSINAQSDKKEPPPPPPKPKEEVKYKVVKYEPPVLIPKDLLEDFYKRNPSVEKITSAGSVISLKMKDGSTEKYDMKNKKEDKAFAEKYGVSPIPPPPPPPTKKLS